MGIVNWFKGATKRQKKKNEKAINSDFDKGILSRSEFDITDEEKRTHYIVTCCEQIMDISKEEDSAKTEYQLVTSYLTDIQEIEKLPLLEKSELSDIAQKIVSIDKERKKYITNNNYMSDVQYYKIEPYENEMPVIINRMKKNEEFQMLVKQDLQHLEGEKGSLSYRKDEIISQQNKMNTLGKVVFTLVAIVFISMMGLQIIYNSQFTLPLILVAFVSILLALGAFIKNYQNHNEVQAVLAKLNRVILLTNKTKIKYVNVTNLLDYMYEKHKVNSSHQLQYLWERYLEAKAQKERYKKTTDDLEFYHRKLIYTLKKYNMKDPNFWSHRAIAIIDSKEMVEVRHELNERRQKLRGNIEFYQNSLKEIKTEITDLVREYPIYAKEIMKIVDSY